MTKMMRSLAVFLCVLMSSCTMSTPTPTTCVVQTYAKILEPVDGSSLPPGHHTIKVSVGDKALELKINGLIVASTSASGPPHAWEYLYNWTPLALGTYVIEARSLGYYCPAGSPWDEVQVTIVGQPYQQQQPGLSDIITPIIMPSSTVSPQASACAVEAAVNLFCRAGPAQAFKDLDSFTPGQTASIVGQSADGFYWYVTGPNLGMVCTVPKDPKFVTLTGEGCERMPVFTPPPPKPTAAPPSVPECSDGIDNDGDGRIDFVAGAAGAIGDRECTSASDNDESSR
jgi:hypothetical protein